MLIIGIPGTTLDDEARRWLDAPQLSGVILFTRNYTDREQLAALIEDIRLRRDRSFLVSVDQEGGPVQRFRDGFTRLPALARIGERHAQDAARAIRLAEEHAWLMASELRAVDVDLSFAPVADLARGNRAIGVRAFDADPLIVSELVQAYVRGMRSAGMAATLKHFPGHGSVAEDTHFDTAIDPRPLHELRDCDLVPFVDGIVAGAEAVMLAHVAYPAVDAAPAGFSQVWIGDILRGDLGFQGVVIGDDIGMAATEAFGGIGERIDAQRRAGCDLVLACNPSIVPEALAASRAVPALETARLDPLLGAVARTWEALRDDPRRTRVINDLAALDANPVEQT
jgi:beta-N-acetylhexosaminidase